MKNIIDINLCSSNKIYRQFIKRIAEGKLTRDEGSRDHFCVTFFLYDLEAKKVFLTHHKKSNLWIAPGGHMDKGEFPLQTLSREMAEELGVNYVPPKNLEPFLLTIFKIANKRPDCKWHYEIWYKILMSADKLKINPEEFNETHWLSIDEAKKLATDKDTLLALEKIARDFFK